MWCFAQAALDLLAECVAEAEAGAEAGAGAAEAGADAAAGTSSSSSSSAVRPPPPPPPLLSVSEDRYGGVEVSVREGGEHEVSGFVAELHAALERWHAAGKRGVWLRLRSEAHGLVSAAVSAGFVYHHATPYHLQLTCWLPQGEPSPLPRYALTQIGCNLTRQRLQRFVQPHVPEAATVRATGCTQYMHMCQVRLHADRRGWRRARCAGPSAHGAGMHMRRTCTCTCGAHGASMHMRRTWCKHAHAAHTVQERVSPSPRMQCSWKLPGGLAEPGGKFAQT